MATSIKSVVLHRIKKNAIETRRILRAYYIAKKRHRKQFRASGAPYIYHLTQVAYFLEKWNRGHQAVIAGLLHDTIEDTGYTKEDIRKQFGARIADLVDGSSWVGKKNGPRDWPATYTKFAHYAKADPELVILKAADYLSNLHSYKDPRRKLYVSEKAAPKNKTFWIPYFRDAGLKKFAKKLETETNKASRSRVPVTVYQYITRKEMARIRKTISQMEGIEELR